MKLKLLVFMLSALALVSCARQNSAKISVTQSTMANYENVAALSLDWTGFYEGTLPCADCSGIKTKLTLNSNNTFELSQTYLNEQMDSIIQTGNFRWIETKPIIELNDNGELLYYKVTENAVIKYDSFAEPIKSKLNYSLKKTASF